MRAGDEERECGKTEIEGGRVNQKKKTAVKISHRIENVTLGVALCVSLSVSTFLRGFGVDRLLCSEKRFGNRSTMFGRLATETG